MNIIKLSAIDSTNSYLRQLQLKTAIADFTVVVAEKQTNGRGQMGTIWQTQAHKNLTASIFTDVSWLNLERSFYISMATSLAVLETVQHFNLRKSAIKWPNDIMADGFKVGGVLIENIIKKQKLQASIIGIGLNVNQTDFEHLPQACSMKSIAGIHYDLDEILNLLVSHLKQQMARLKRMHFNAIMQDYESHLFRKNKPSTFENIKGERFSGFINGISSTGKLKVLLEDEIIKEFDLKQIKLLY
ncbi:biotin--[acetyl-CoA-carboxylase] ligase [Sediminibacter sp. Hel_I_10]|uniref:biotin--[acetyl-CoA-carboxylase] ligase n=1 Tax=Sediminibacter sp. Hel_I_10 TaxID=1392490 RepID=UPI00047C8AC2|nr:biotin--[acetyl-CoA-carboxylase] ligase [Sediminibacter sp. Hel_I_10]